MRLPFTLSVAAAAAILAACSSGESVPGREAAAFPGTFDDGVLTLDTHVDIPLEFATDAADPLEMQAQVSLRSMRNGALDAAFFVVYVAQAERTPENYRRAHEDALTKFAAIERMTEELYPDWIELAYSAADVERIAGQRKLVAAIGVENGFSIGTDLSTLDRFHALGARYFGLVHNGHNDLAHSAQPRAAFGDAPGSEAGGVTELGAAAIERLNRLGVMVDISHSSKQTALDAIRLSSAPVIASHSSVKALADHPRNLDDETLLALRDNGGVVQIVAYEGFLTVQPLEQSAALAALGERLGLEGPVDNERLMALPEEQRFAYLRGVQEIQSRWPPASVEDLVDHIDYAVRLIGVDHVGVSSDFGGGGGVLGWTGAAETPNVTAELERRGYSAADIDKIWSGNLLRVWREAERVAAEQASR